MPKENKYIITEEINTTEEDLTDIICTAFEGGIGHWGCVDNTKSEWKDKPDDMPVSEFVSKLLISGKEITIFDAELEEDELTEEDIWTLNLEKLLSGIKKYIEASRPSCLYTACLNQGNVDAFNIDIEDADCIIQYALFGELTFG